MFILTDKNSDIIIYSEVKSCLHLGRYLLGSAVLLWWKASCQVCHLCACLAKYQAVEDVEGKH